MAGKFYAWTNFDVERNEWGQTVNVIHVGDEVSQQQLNVTDDQWNELVATGAVSEQEYPQDIPPDMSPAEYLRNRVLSGEADEDETAAFNQMVTRSGQAETESTKAAAAAEGEEESSSTSSSSGTTPKTQTASSSKSGS